MLNPVTNFPGGCEYTVWAHGDGDTLITASPAILCGVFCNVQVTGASTVEDGSTAAGTVVVTIPNGMTVGTYYELGCKMDDGIFIDDGSSAGTVVILWRYQ